MTKDKIIESVEQYYTDKVKKHGATPQGVDWNSNESQYIRFEQLFKVVDKNAPYTLLDYGCGYGEFVHFLNYKNTHPYYTGFDISDEMIRVAKQKHAENSRVTFVNNLQNASPSFDYVVASGIFNVKVQHKADEEWTQYVLGVLDEIHALSTLGFSFNVLTKYSDKEYMKDYLYYADPLFLFDYCKKHFSKNVALLHDYHLYEFTIIIRKNEK